MMIKYLKQYQKTSVQRLISVIFLSKFINSTSEIALKCHNLLNGVNNSEV